MNPSKSLCLTLFLLAFAASAPSAERFRTDINPSLIYYQAFALPDLSEQDRQFLFVQEWRGRPLDAHFEEVIVKTDNKFKLIRQAAKQQVPCDWGLDLTQGPDTLLPGLAKAKSIAQTARLRVRWHLEHSRQAEAREDLLAAFAFSRNVSKDKLIISALVQIAMENILASAVAENFFQFSPETLGQLAAGFDASPARGTIQQCMAVEKATFLDWFVAKVREFQAESPTDDGQVLAKVRALFARTLAGGDEKPDPGLPDRVIAASGGTSAGLLARFKELEPIYDESTAILGLPFDKYGAASKAFEARLATETNPLAAISLPAINKARTKEFGIEVRLAMVHAAIEHRLHGGEAFQKVADPCGSGPFRFERLLADGVDRGFVLKSRLNTRGFDESLVFVEKDGPALQVDGLNAGQPLPK